MADGGQMLTAGLRVLSRHVIRHHVCIFTCGEWYAGSRNGSRNTGRRHRGGLGSWEGPGDGALGFDVYFGGRVSKLHVA